MQTEVKLTAAVEPRKPRKPLVWNLGPSCAKRRPAVKQAEPLQLQLDGGWKCVGQCGNAFGQGLARSTARAVRAAVSGRPERPWAVRGGARTAPSLTPHALKLHSAHLEPCSLSRAQRCRSTTSAARAAAPRLSSVACACRCLRRSSATTGSSCSTPSVASPSPSTARVRFNAGRWGRSLSSTIGAQAVPPSQDGRAMPQSSRRRGSSLHGAPSPTTRAAKNGTVRAAPVLHL